MSTKGIAHPYSGVMLQVKLPVAGGVADVVVAEEALELEMPRTTQDHRTFVRGVRLTLVIWLRVLLSFVNSVVDHTLGYNAPYGKSLTSCTNEQSLYGT